MTTVRNALLINFVQNYGIIALQFVASLILARLLSPPEIGVFSVAATLIGLAQVVRDFGVGQYVIQEQELTQIRIRAAFTVSLTISAVLALITAGLCNIAAEFYREPGVRDVMLVLAVNFLLIPFGQTTLAVLQREMRFGAIAWVKTGSAICHFVTSIGLAYFGYSYMSLALASLVGVLSSACIANLFRPKDMPWGLNFSEAGRVISFGSFTVLTNFSAALAKGVSDLVLGRMINMTAVGLFSRASGLIEMFNQGVMSTLWAVALPHFAKSIREGGDVRYEYLRSMSLITGVAWPFFSILMLFADSLVLLLYGTAWYDCVPLVRWISGAFIIISPFYLFSSVLMALGKVRYVMWIEVGTLPIQFVFYITGAIGGDLESVAAANVAYATVKAVVIYLVLRKQLDFGFQQFIEQLWPSFVVMIICSGISLFVSFALGPVGLLYWQHLIVGGGTAVLGFCVGVFVAGHPLRDEIISIGVRLGICRHR